MGESFETGRAVFRLVDLAGAEAMQQGAQDAAHVRIVVDDEEAQPVEVDADHWQPEETRERTPPARPVQARESSLRKCLGCRHAGAERSEEPGIHNHDPRVEISVGEGG